MAELNILSLSQAGDSSCKSFLLFVTIAVNINNAQHAWIRGDKFIYRITQYLSLKINEIP